MDYFSIIFGIFIFIIGLIAGSFLNCLLYRMHLRDSGVSLKGKKQNFLTGRSFCPKCKHLLSWKDLIPIFSFIILGERCRYCKKKISWQYPLVELATGLMFVLAFSYWLLNSTSALYLLFLTISFFLLVGIFVYDLRYFLIPDEFILCGIIITLLYRDIDYSQFLIINSILAALVACIFFLVIYLLSRGKWMGFGDVKLAFFLGLLLGSPNIFVGLFLAFLFGAIIGVGLMIWKKKDFKSEVPFGPFLVIGTLVAFFWGTQLINFYFNTIPDFLFKIFFNV